MAHRQSDASSYLSTCSSSSRMACSNFVCRSLLRFRRLPQSCATLDFLCSLPYCRPLPGPNATGRSCLHRLESHFAACGATAFVRNSPSWSRPYCRPLPGPDVTTQPRLRRLKSLSAAHEGHTAVTACLAMETSPSPPPRAKTGGTRNARRNCFSFFGFANDTCFLRQW